MFSSDRLTLRYPDPSESDRVIHFGADNSSRGSVAARVRNEGAISRRLLVAAYDDGGNIVASSALQILSEGQTIDCVTRTDGATTERGRIAELVGILPIKHERKNLTVPQNLWNTLLFSLPEIIIWDRALPVDVLITNVQTRQTSTINLITGAPSTKSPLRWERFHPAAQLVHASKSLTEDESMGRPNDFFRAPVNNLPEVAKMLLQRIRQGYITGYAGDKIYVDFSALKLEEPLKAIISKSWYFKKFLHNSSWSEASRTFGSLTRKDMPNRPARESRSQNIVAAPPTNKLLPSLKIACGGS